jgi:hypothetical protein
MTSKGGTAARQSFSQNSAAPAKRTSASSRRKGVFLGKFFSANVAPDGRSGRCRSVGVG